jgi:hypothetical protein
MYSFAKMTEVGIITDAKSAFLPIIIVSMGGSDL